MARFALTGEEINLNRLLSSLAAGALYLTILPASEAALVSRMGGLMVYDTELDITWLADANLAASEDFAIVRSSTELPDPDNAPLGATGRMRRDTATAWLQNMNADNGGAGYLGFDNWRLASTSPPDPTCSRQMEFSDFSDGFNCTGNELGYLFYETMGVSAGDPISSSDNPDLDLFTNIQDEQLGLVVAYWFSDAVDRSDSINDGTATGDIAGYIFEFNSGELTVGGGTLSGFLWPVLDGDVVVPVPAAASLFGSALGLLGWIRRRMS